MTNRGTIISRHLFILYMITVCYLCFNSFSGMSLDKTHILGFETDKVIHFAMFLPFMGLSYLSLGKRFSSPLKCIGAITAIFVTGLVIAALTELIQGWFTTTRVSDVADFRADAIALIVGAAAVYIAEIFRSR